MSWPKSEPSQTLTLELVHQREPGQAKGDGFANFGLSRENYANANKLNKIIRNAFAMVQLPEYTPHSLRKTLALYGDEVCQNMEQRKAWSLNMGHENLATTISAYMPVTSQRQRELIKEIIPEHV